MNLRLFNSLSKQLEDFEPINDKLVGVYACGPTVYDYPHIGNWRTFTLGDILVRTLEHFGYHTHYVMNITDVGHLTGDNLGDADTGEDRLEKGAKREGKTAWDVARFYATDFENSYKKLGLTVPTLEDGHEGYCVATDHISEQIAMVKKIEEKGFTYKISDGVYFDVRAYEQAGNEYGLMSNIHKDNAEARVVENKEKRDQRDFALWKFSYPSGRDFDPKIDDEAQKRHMEWESPWGLGFPGWHIECSAMSVKYLGEQFDIHLGGEDHKSTHHPNEIAQAEAASGKKPFVKYWLHCAFLQVDGGRMGKSLGNAYTLSDVEKKGFKPEHLRYFYLSGHYRQPLNFTWQSLEAARDGLERLYEKASFFGEMSVDIDSLNREPSQKVREQFLEFEQALADDLNTPKALAALHLGLKQARDNYDEMYLFLKSDEVLGLNFVEQGIEKFRQNQDFSSEFRKELSEREELKKNSKYKEADEIRKKIEAQGYHVDDTQDGVVVRKVR